MKSNTNITNYNDERIWKNYDSTGLISGKLNIVTSFIPEDVKSIIDVGCGNGIITNHLAQQFDVTGVDFSDIALEYVTCNKIHSSSDSIPVDDNSFDMVFSSELLEHLPNDILNKTIEEFKRIAKQYILITVPNNEFLDASFVKCRNCQNVFHPYGHIQTFQLKDLVSRLNSNFELIRSGEYGPKKKRYNPFLLSIKHNYADRWFYPGSVIICPNCSNDSFLTEKGNLVSKACNLMNRIVSQSKEYWLFALFERKNKSL